MYPGKPCHFVSDVGCRIYEQRPVSPCRKFVCAWVASPGSFQAFHIVQRRNSVEFSFQLRQNVRPNNGNHIFHVHFSL